MYKNLNAYFGARTESKARIPPTRNVFLPLSEDLGRYAPVTAAIGHEPSSLRSSGDGHRVPMTFSDTSNLTANQGSIGDLIVETRFYPPVENETKMSR